MPPWNTISGTIDGPVAADRESSPARSLLREYALAWGERALRGRVLPASSDDDPLEIVLVDPFAGADHPLPPARVPVPVALLARLLASAGGRPSRARAVLVEEDPVKAAWLVEACARAGLGGRTGRPEGEDVPEIAVVEGGWDEGARLWAGLGPAGAEIALLDPPSAGRLPLERLLSLSADRPAMDLLLRFPVSDLRRLARFRGIPLADLPPYARRSADGISRLLGDPRHEWALAWTRRSEEGEAAAEAALVEAFAGRLREGTGKRVRVFRAGPSGAEELLLLASDDPARILLMNEVLFRARTAGLATWPEEGGLVRFVARGELELFGGAAGERGEGRDRVVDLPGLAHSLAEAFAGRRVPYAEVLGSLLESELFEADVRRALGELRREGRALYRSLAAPGAEVAFPRRGAGSPAARSRARKREPGAEELFLALDPEEE